MDYKEEIIKLLRTLRTKFLKGSEISFKIYSNEDIYLAFGLEQIYEKLNNPSYLGQKIFKVCLRLNQKIVGFEEVYDYFKEKNKLDMLLSTLQKEVIDGL